MFKKVLIHTRRGIKFVVDSVKKSEKVLNYTFPDFLIVVEYK